MGNQSIEEFLVFTVVISCGVGHRINQLIGQKRKLHILIDFSISYSFGTAEDTGKKVNLLHGHRKMKR